MTGTDKLIKVSLLHIVTAAGLELNGINLRKSAIRLRSHNNPTVKVPYHE